MLKEIRTVKAVLLDLGNVVVSYDNMIPVRNLMPYLVGVGLTEATLHERLFGARGNAWRQMTAGQMRPPQFAAWARKEFKFPRSLTDDAFLQIVGGALGRMEETIALVREVRDLKLDIPFVAVSNIEPPRMAEVARLGVDALFDHLTYSCVDRVVKPDPELVRYALMAVRVAPEDAFYVDDLAENLVGPQKMGVPVHLFTCAECLALDLQRRLPGRPKLNRYRLAAADAPRRDLSM